MATAAAIRVVSVPSSPRRHRRPEEAEEGQPQPQKSSPSSPTAVASTAVEATAAERTAEVPEMTAAAASTADGGDDHPARDGMHDQQQPQQSLQPQQLERRQQQQPHQQPQQRQPQQQPQLPQQQPHHPQQQQQQPTPIMEPPDPDQQVGLSLSVGSQSAPSFFAPGGAATSRGGGGGAASRGGVLSPAFFVPPAASHGAANDVAAVNEVARRVTQDAMSTAAEAAAASRATANDDRGGDDGFDASLLPGRRRPGRLTVPTLPLPRPMPPRTVSSPALPPNDADVAGTAPLEARIMQLEQSLSAVTQLCQTLLLQQQQGLTELRRGRSGEGSEATSEVYTPPRDNSPTTTMPAPSSRDSDDLRLLSRWPPSHHLLESPEASTRQRLQQRQQIQSTRKSNNRGSLGESTNIDGNDRPGMANAKTMSMVLLDINPGENRGPNMIPFTSDLDACDEMDGDSVAGGCRDVRGRALTSSSGSGSDGDAGENRRLSRRLLDRSCRGRRNRSGGSQSRSGSESQSIDGSKTNSRSGSESLSVGGSSSTRRRSEDAGDGEKSTSSNEGSPSSPPFHRSGRRLSSSLKCPHPENHLECQTFADTHLEALRLRREVGKGRAYSLNDSDLLQGGAVAARNGEQQWRPALHVLDGSDGEQDPAVSAISAGTFADAPSLRESEGGSDKMVNIHVPDLPLPDQAAPRELEATTHMQASRSDGRNNETSTEAPFASTIVATKAKRRIETKSVGTNTAITSTDISKHTSSCSSNLSSQTLRSGNSNNLQVSSSANTQPRDGNRFAMSTALHKAERSQSITSSKSDKSSTSTKDGSSADALGDARDTSMAPPKQRDSQGKSPHKNEIIKAKSPRDSSEGDAKKGKAPHAVMDDGKTGQTMKEYVINDLLNIDSRNHDGSATEDIDENMEEFLRIPSKLEWLMVFSLAVCMDSFLYAWAMLPLKFLWGLVCLFCSTCSAGRGVRGIKFHRRHLYPIMQGALIIFVYSQVLCPISIGKLYHWIRGQAMLKLYVLIAIVEVFDRLLCSFGQDAWDSLYWNTTRRPRHPRMFVSIMVVGVYVTIHTLFLFVHVATLSVAVNSADNALLTLLISGNFAEIKSTVFKKYNKQNLFKITTSDICERFKLALFLLLILFLNRFQGEMTSSMVKDYYSMCGIVFVAELISDWIKHSFITKFNLIKSGIYFDYALILSGDVTGIGHEGLNLDYTHAAVKRLGLAQIPLVCVTARYLHEAVRFAIAFHGNGDEDHPVAALVELMADGNKWKFYTGLLQGLVLLVLFKIALGICIRFVARGYLGGSSDRLSKATPSSLRKNGNVKTLKEGDVKKKQ